jgi:ABC-type sugar transport system permease subunit
VYRAIDGTFTGPGGAELRPGFQTTIGTANFERFFNSPALQGPLVRIITWNFAFALISVVSTFSLGLGIAFIYNDRTFPGRKIIQSLLLIPYTIPSLITILIWRGLLNPEVGIINRTIEAWFNFSPPWFTDQWWAKAGVLLVNLWLGYPYFMLICSGALQAIPEDIYRAAEVDGANGWQRFRQITLPLLLVAVGPLLIASFTFNFNNFNLIFLFVQGGPPIAGAASRAGHTDILISYVYNLAFAGGRGADYGLASAVTIIIFIIVAAITLFQFRYTRMWEEVGENV